MKVAELSGALLDSWVARKAPQCEGCELVYIADHDVGPHYVGKYEGGVAFFIPTTGIAQVLRLRREYGCDDYRPSINWTQGGVIIEHEKLELAPLFDARNKFVYWSSQPAGMGHLAMDDPKPLIAAMRAYVASQFGAEVDNV